MKLSDFGLLEKDWAEGVAFDYSIKRFFLVRSVSDFLKSNNNRHVVLMKMTDLFYIGSSQDFERGIFRSDWNYKDYEVDEYISRWLCFNPCINRINFDMFTAWVLGDINVARELNSINWLITGTTVSPHDKNFSKKVVDVALKNLARSFFLLMLKYKIDWLDYAYSNYSDLETANDKSE